MYKLLAPGLKRKQNQIYEDDVANQRRRRPFNDVSNYTQNQQDNTMYSNTNQGITNISSIMKGANLQNCTINIQLPQDDKNQ